MLGQGLGFGALDFILGVFVVGVYLSWIYTDEDEVMAGQKGLPG